MPRARCLSPDGAETKEATADQGFRDFLDDITRHLLSLR